MVNMNEMVELSKDKRMKAVFNSKLVEMFNEFGGCENNALDLIMDELKEAGIELTRKQVQGKLSISGVKQIVKQKPKAKKKEGPTKKDLIVAFLRVVGLSIGEVDSLNNMRKADIEKLTEAVNNLLPE